MSTQITTAFVQQYKDNVMHLSQQKGSRLRACVTEEHVTGESVFFDLIGQTAAQKRTTRHGDTPLVETPHTRRKCILADYVLAGGMAMGRAYDDVIIAAFNATAITGKDGTGTATLPAGQKISAAAAGLTIAKLRAADKALNKGEVEKEERFIVTTAEQIEDLLATTEVTSSDYNTVKALKQGEIDTFLGFKFIHSERLPLDGSGNRLCFAWQRRGIRLGVGMDMTTRIDERSDKSYATQIYLSQTIGAVRMEEARVVEIACVE
jgi:hypothetical protein